MAAGGVAIELESKVSPDAAIDSGIADCDFSPVTTHELIYDHPETFVYLRGCIERIDRSSGLAVASEAE